MQDEQTFGVQNQAPPHWGHLPYRSLSANLLDNRSVQIPFRDTVEFRDSYSQTNKHPSKLDELKKRRFTEEDKDERVARSLAALNQQTSIHLSPEEWELIAEDPDIEDQF